MQRRDVLRGAIAIAVGVPTMTGAVSEVADAALIELGKEFEQAWADEKAFYASHDLSDPINDLGFEAAYTRTQDLIYQIENTPAHSLGGLRVKARAVQWCYGTDEIDLDGKTTDVRLASQILKTILTI